MDQPPADVLHLNAATAQVYLGDALRMLRSAQSRSFDAVVCDPPYAMKATQDPAHERRTQRTGIGCIDCGSPAASGYDACADCLDELRIQSFADAAMLGQQSPNWHAKATHSRGYADNNNVAFGAWVSVWAKECLRVLRPGGHLVAFGGTRTWHRLAVGVEDAGFEMRDSLAWLYATGVPKSLNVTRSVAGLHRDPTRQHRFDLSQAARRRSVPTAGDRTGMYTGIKPAHEPVIVARKPMVGTAAENLDAFGVGAFDVDGTRLDNGRWPSNVFLDSHQADQFETAIGAHGSRFFFVAKPDARERVTVDGVAHPTVKPLSLMRELVRLVTPPGGLVLDPFAGSGTTVEACLLEDRDCVAIERDPQYLPLITARVARHQLATSPGQVGSDAPTGSTSGAPNSSALVDDAQTLF